MNKTKKILLVTGIILLVLILVAIIVVGLNLGKIAKAAVEKVGPQITKTTVTLDAVNLSILSGSAKVKGLLIGNPEGYKSPDAISVGLADVGVNPFSILSDKIVIRHIRVDAAEITFEGNPLSGNNLSQIMQNVNDTAKAGGPKSADTNTTAKAKSPQKLEVDDFLITNTKVHVRLSGSDQETIITLPDIHLTNLGTGADGITATDLTRRVLSNITTSTIKALANDPAALGQDVGKAADKLKKGISDLLKK